ncbi:hypothetical protein [Hoeflea marina]|nr:hypothetical protein [Hoeflea marina]
MATVTLFTLLLAASSWSWRPITGPRITRPIEEALIDAPLAQFA